MRAVIRTGGKQYRVAVGDVVALERVAAEAGNPVTFDEILMASDGDQAIVGAPLIKEASVAATVEEHTRAPRIIVFKKKRRKNHRKRRGHRQQLTVVRITGINVPGLRENPQQVAKPEPADAAPSPDAPTETPADTSADSPA